MKKIQLKSKMKRRYDFLNIQDMTTDKVFSRDLNLNGCENSILGYNKSYISFLGGWNISL